MAQRWRIAVDIGGTFTDIQILNEESGLTYSHKTATTPEAPARGLIRGILESAQLFDFALNQVSSLLHGTTIATNAVLERKLAKGALITTAGFADVLEIGRHVRRDIYSLKAEQRTLLIPRRHRYTVIERVNAKGQVTQPLDVNQAHTVVSKLAETECQAVAICLLHAYANPAHEQQLAELIQQRLPQLYISLSSVISPELREFERSSTTVLNALLMPLVGDYLTQLQKELAAHGFTAPVYLVQSNGGVTTPTTAALQPARLLLSGPSGGALAAHTISCHLAIKNIIAADMGGTSFDISIVNEGSMRIISQGEVADCPIRLPMVEMRTIGAGGGSIASVDAGKRLHVGSQSAGAIPGPICYQRGGKEVTVTDANVVLGRLAPDHFLGGTMHLATDQARTLLADTIAQPLSLNTEQAALGINQITNNKMAAAIRLSLFEKGLDPEDFALLAFGGAGGLHALDVAQELGIKQVVFPANPGTLSAWGMLFADIQHDYSRSFLTPASTSSLANLQAIAANLYRQAEQQLQSDNIDPTQRSYQLLFDMRYPGQAYEILVPCQQLEPNQAALNDSVQRFHTLHHEQYAHAEQTVTPEIVTLRLKATGHLEKPNLQPLEPITANTYSEHTTVYFTDGWQEIAVYQRHQLASKTTVQGPALIIEPHSTLLLPADWSLTMTDHGDLIATQDDAHD